MVGRSHLLTGAATALAVSSLIALPALQGLPAVVVGGAAALLPDIDEPGSTIGRRMPLLGALLATAAAIATTPAGMAGLLDSQVYLSRVLVAFAVGMLAGFAAPWIINALFGHRDLVHDGVLGLLLLAGAYLWWRQSGNVALLFLAVGWVAHLAGDALTPAGIPFGRWRLHLLPRLLRIRTGGPGERLVVCAWLLRALYAWLLQGGPGAVAQALQVLWQSIAG